MILNRTIEEFSMGHSNGSGLAYSIAEYMLERFAAFAPIGSNIQLYDSVEVLPEADENAIKYGPLSLGAVRRAARIL